MALDYAPLDRLLQAVVGAAKRAVADPDPGGQEAYGDWIREELSAPCADALTGLRGRKLVWWLDAPRPLRAVAARGAKYEVSVVALPGGCSLPPAAFPRGSVIYCAPLLGQFTVRRLRFDITGKGDAIELMRRTLKQGDAPLVLSGGSCHEYRCAPGVAATSMTAVPEPAAVPLAPRQKGVLGWSEAAVAPFGLARRLGKLSPKLQTLAEAQTLARRLAQTTFSRVAYYR